MAPSLLEQLNGERAVVLLYVGRILFSCPLSLLPEAFSLSFLSLFALSVEIPADDASNPLSYHFKTRPGASSGIFLGTVTLPGLLVSRLIQILRSESLQEVRKEEFAYLKLQYWAAAATCLSVLIYLSIVCQSQGKSTNSICSHSKWSPVYSFICTILLVGFSVASLSGKLYGVWSLTLMSLWVLVHGLAAVTLIQKIFQMFPACASIGESLLVTSGLVVYFGDMVAYTFANQCALRSSKERFCILLIYWRHLCYFMQGTICGLLIFPVFYKYVVAMWEYFASLGSNACHRDSDMRRSLVFYGSITFMLVVVVPSWMQFVHAFHLHPLLWVVEFVLSEPQKRLTLCIYWLVIISWCVRRFYDISKNSKTERILLRKYYHLMAVSIFVPALIFQPKFLDLAFGAALAVFLLLEIIRIWKIWPLGHLVHQFMNAFTDHRDSDLLVVSHFSLLLGCAIPIWLSSGFTDRPLAPFAGILSLGIGDTMASMVGHKYGVLRWSKTGKKTIEGTAAGITSVLAACFLLLPLLAATGYIFTMQWFSLILAVTTSGLLEAYTAQLDNAFIPLIFYSLLCLTGTGQLGTRTKLAPSWAARLETALAVVKWTDTSQGSESSGRVRVKAPHPIKGEGQVGASADGWVTGRVGKGRWRRSVRESVGNVGRKRADGTFLTGQ
ncbi:phosphatidate cytidylyltransferase family protein [Striga hermonthica]|uniref:dolichol kinase n=1 Tax=Striga hermonthica TaxID=68872 RepID=A0A9N7MTB6_STRHE|nr:phosphatidate cytidylyltransferase family protein [Striga hermonthica]